MWNSINHTKTTNKVAKYKIIALLVKYLGIYVSTINKTVYGLRVKSFKHYTLHITRTV